MNGVQRGGYYQPVYGHAIKTRVAMRFYDWYWDAVRGYLGFLCEWCNKGWAF